MASLSYDTVVDIEISTSVADAQADGFGVLNTITNDGGSITRKERYRTYASIDGVAEDFDTDSEAYISAQTYFSQVPRPSEMMISVRYEAAQVAELRCGTVTDFAQFENIVDGSFAIPLNGSIQTIQDVDFTLAPITSMEDVATVISPFLIDATCTYEDSNLYIRTDNTGEAFTIGFLSPAAIGTDLSAMMKALSADDGATFVDGIDGETITDSLTAIQDIAGAAFYGFQFTKEVRDSAVINGEDAVLAASLWAQSQVKVFFNTTNNLDSYSAVTTSDIGSKLKDLSQGRVITTFSSYPNQYPSSSVAARAFTVNFDVADSTITLKFKKLPNISVEDLTYSQYKALKAKNINFLSNVGGNSMYQEGVMADGTFFDTRHGLDWLENATQVAAFNALYTDGKKVPYTNAGVAKVTAAIREILQQAVANGLGAAGYYENSEGEDVFLPLGYEITAAGVNSQLSTNRAARHYAGISFILIGAGAIHSVTINGVFAE